MYWDLDPDPSARKFSVSGMVNEWRKSVDVEEEVAERFAELTARTRKFLQQSRTVHNREGGLPFDLMMIGCWNVADAWGKAAFNYGQKVDELEQLLAEVEPGAVGIESVQKSFASSHVHFGMLMREHSSRKVTTHSPALRWVSYRLLDFPLRVAPKVLADYTRAHNLSTIHIVGTMATGAMTAAYHTHWLRDLYGWVASRKDTKVPVVDFRFYYPPLDSTSSEVSQIYGGEGGDRVLAIPYDELPRLSIGSSYRSVVSACLRDYSHTGVYDPITGQLELNYNNRNDFYM